MLLSDGMRKALRKRIAIDGSKTITLQALSNFIGEDLLGAGLPKPIVHDASAEDALCMIPREVPELPERFHPREGPLEELIACLIQGHLSSPTTVSLTAPAARNSTRNAARNAVTRNAVTSQGMGGCG